MQEHPNVTVQYTHEGGNFDQKYQVLAAGGQTPDVGFGTVANYKSHVARGLAGYLDDLAKRDKAFKEAEYDAYWLEALRYKGRLAGLPWDPGMVCLMFNRSLLQKAGVPSPERQHAADVGGHRRPRQAPDQGHGRRPRPVGPGGVVGAHVVAGPPPAGLAGRLQGRRARAQAGRPHRPGGAAVAGRPAPEAPRLAPGPGRAAGHLRRWQDRPQRGRRLGRRQQPPGHAGRLGLGPAAAVQGQAAGGRWARRRR